MQRKNWSRLSIVTTVPALLGFIVRKAEAIERGGAFQKYVVDKFLLGYLRPIYYHSGPNMIINTPALIPSSTRQLQRVHSVFARSLLGRQRNYLHSWVRHILKWTSDACCFARVVGMLGSLCRIVWNRRGADDFVVDCKDGIKTLMTKWRRGFVC